MSQFGPSYSEYPYMSQSQPLPRQNEDIYDVIYTGGYYGDIASQPSSGDLGFGTPIEKLRQTPTEQRSAVDEFPQSVNGGMQSQNMDFNDSTYVKQLGLDHYFPQKQTPQLSPMSSPSSRPKTCASGTCAKSKTLKVPQVVPPMSNGGSVVDGSVVSGSVVDNIVQDILAESSTPNSTMTQTRPTQMDIYWPYVLDGCVLLFVYFVLSQRNVKYEIGKVMPQINVTSDYNVSNFGVLSYGLLLVLLYMGIREGIKRMTK